MAAVRKPAEPPLVRVIDDAGRVLDKAREPEIPEADLLRLLRGMIVLRRCDERLLRMQRQGRLGFYMTSTGEEAAQLGSAYATRPEDWVFPSYREPAVALWRGYPLRTFVCQLLGNAEDPVQGRQMPVHHSWRPANFVSISSPVGTQIPQAVGAAWAAKLRGDRVAAITYFGDGATSTSDFHVAMNFAGVYQAPCVLLCRNNRWAISVPYHLQTGSSTIAQKAVAYGIEGVRVDGNDLLAVYAVTRDALDKARSGGGPTLIEAETYRVGSHSTSDDPSAYRDKDEPKKWEKKDPIARFRKYLGGKGVWTEKWEEQVTAEADAEVVAAIKAAEAVDARPAVETMFEEVYADVPWHLREQRKWLMDYLHRHGPVGHER